MKSRLIISRLFLPAASLIVVLAVSAISVSAVARGYLSDDSELKPGMVVRLSSNSTADEQKVERATLEDIDRIIGVTVTSDESDVTIASAAQTIYVESVGEATAYVSDLEGAVRKGDLLTISPLKGILSKGHPSSKFIFGIALEDMADKQKEVYRIEDNNGPRSVELTKIKVNLDRVGANGQQSAMADSSLERLGRSIVGKEVGEIRVVIALIIFLIVLVAEGAILYGAISSAITALGRNPLARNIIKRELFRVVVIALLVLTFGLGAIYTILWV